MQTVIKTSKTNNDYLGANPVANLKPIYAKKEDSLMDEISAGRSTGMPIGGSAEKSTERYTERYTEPSIAAVEGNEGVQPALKVNPLSLESVPTEDQF